ncbi:hypothetical protein [Georgenia sp. H159]|uniref:hypothetical protein n=1 Tax=Georgenia sp. H159 TaxID=3076115 RepID=UPI002D7985EF|nr:hypothetical protein [Georgenia sp. H159]
MAGKGIQIDFVSDVSKFIRGTDDIGRALDEVADSLDDVAKEGEQAGKKAGDGLKDGIEDGAKDTERALKDVEDTAKRELNRVEDHAKDAGEGLEKAADGSEKKFRQSFDKVTADSKTTGDALGRNIKRGMDEGERASDTFKQEAGQNFSETMSSFDGSLEGLLDGIQGTFGGIVADLGPAGMVGGAFVAAGIGLGVAFLQQSADKAAEVKEQVIALADAINEAGGNINEIDWGAQFREFGNEIADPKSWFEPWQEASRTNAEVIAEDAEKLGLTYETLFRGMAGSSQDAALALGEIDAALASATAEAQRLHDDGMDPMDAAVEAGVIALQDYRGKLEDATDATANAVEIEELHRQALEGSEAAIHAYNDQMEEKIGLLQEEADMNMSAAEANAAWAQQTMDNATALEELNELIDTSTEATRAQTDAVTDGGTALDLYTDAGQKANETLIGTAEAGWDMVEAAREQGASTDQLRDKTQTARDEFIRVAEQMGLTRAAAERLADEYGLVPGEISTTAVLHTGEAMSRLEALDRTLNTIDGRTVTAAVAIQQYGNAAMNSGGQVPGAASGRYITGRGSDVEDMVMTPLSPGEFVMDAQATQRIGPGVLQALNEGQGITPAQAPAQLPPIHLTVYLGDEQITDRMRVVAQDEILEREHQSSMFSRMSGLA